MLARYMYEFDSLHRGWRCSMTEDVLLKKKNRKGRGNVKDKINTVHKNIKDKIKL